MGALKDSVVGSGSLSQTTSYSPVTTVNAGAGSAVSTATINGNKYISKGSGGYSGSINMQYTMGGQGILSANLNTGAGAVQQNSVVTMIDGRRRRGGGLNGFSPNTTIPTAAH